MGKGNLMGKTKRTEENRKTWNEENLNVWNDEYSKSIQLNVGRAIKKRRLEIGLEAKAVAGTLGISQEQLRKFENGVNSIRIQKMWKFCQLLRKPLTYFFEDTYSHDKKFNTSDKRIRQLMHMFDGLGDKDQAFVMNVCKNTFENRKL